MTPEHRDLLANLAWNQRELMTMAARVFGSVGYTQYAADLLKLKVEAEVVWAEFTARHPDEQVDE